MTELRCFINSQINVSDEDLGIILSYFKELSIEKDRHLLKKGQTANAYYFIQSGGLRIYFEKGDRQITAWLAFENDFFTELSSLKSQTPTMFNIQALETTTLLSIDRMDMEFLYQRFPAWQQFGRQVWEDAFLKVVNAILSYQTMTAEERYIYLMEQSDVLQRVPLKQLASYLGITQTSLSRLRKSIK
jgi:CRP-like cAMP-binding protein